MPYLGSNSLENLQQSSTVITPFDSKRLKCGAYELSLGNEVFQTDSKSGKKEILKDKGEQVIIMPGQFSLLLTEEEINIPTDKIAFISIKASIKLKGLINVSGFHVDPGFKGKLVFSVYNAGPAKIILERGEPYFPIWFAELSENDTYSGEHKGQNSIPAKYIEALKAGELASPNALSERIDKLDFKKNYIQWLLITIIGILSTALVKNIWDWDQYKKGMESGYTRKTEEVAIDSSINKLLLEKKSILYSIDSINAVKK